MANTPDASISLSFPDGSVREFPAGITGREIAEGISKSLSKKSVAISLNDELQDLADPIQNNGEIQIVTRDDPRALELIRHDAAHVMAEAVQELFPGTQVTIGPGDREWIFITISPATNLLHRMIFQKSRRKCARSFSATSRLKKPSGRAKKAHQVFC